MNKLVEQLKNQEDVTSIYIDPNKEQVNDAALEKLLQALNQQNGVQEIILQNHQITDKSVQLLSQYLSQNELIDEVDLRQNQIGDEGAQQLASAIQKNTSVKRLNLSGNKLSKAGQLNLISSLKENKSLEELYLFNEILDEVTCSQIISYIQDNQSLKLLSINAANNHQFNQKLHDILQRNIIQDINQEEEKALYDAVQGIAKSQLEQVSINNIQIKNQGTKLVAYSVYQSINIQSLQLNLNLISEAGVKALFSVLQYNKSLQQLALRQNCINDDACIYLARCLRQNSNVIDLDLYQNDIGDIGASALGDLLKSKNCSLKILNLCWNVITDVGTQQIADSLKQNSILQQLYLNCDTITKQACTFFQEMLQTNKTLTNLQLNVDENDPQFQQISKLLNKNIQQNIENLPCIQEAKHIIQENKQKQLMLDNQEIKDAGIKDLVPEFKTNTNIQDISLCHNGISDEGAISISHLIQTSKYIKILNLSNNKIGDIGVQYITNALSSNKILQELYLQANNITDTGAKFFGDLLKVNFSLIKLNLDTNPITNKGLELLCQGLKVNQSLMYLYINCQQIDNLVCLQEAAQQNKFLFYISTDQRLQGPGKNELECLLNQNKLNIFIELIKKIEKQLTIEENTNYISANTELQHISKQFQSFRKKYLVSQSQSIDVEELAQIQNIFNKINQLIEIARQIEQQKQKEIDKQIREAKKKELEQKQKERELKLEQEQQQNNHEKLSEKTSSEKSEDKYSQQVKQQQKRNNSISSEEKKSQQLQQLLAKSSPTKPYINQNTIYLIQTDINLFEYQKVFYWTLLNLVVQQTYLSKKSNAQANNTQESNEEESDLQFSEGVSALSSLDLSRFNEVLPFINCKLVNIIDHLIDRIYDKAKLNNKKERYHILNSFFNIRQNQLEIKQEMNKEFIETAYSVAEAKKDYILQKIQTSQTVSDYDFVEHVWFSSKLSEIQKEAQKENNNIFNGKVSLLALQDVILLLIYISINHTPDPQDLQSSSRGGPQVKDYLINIVKNKQIYEILADLQDYNTSVSVTEKKSSVCSNFCQIFSVYAVKYDNPLLNNNELLEHLSQALKQKKLDIIDSQQQYLTYTEIP